MKYSYSPKYPLEILEKIHINKAIGQFFFGKTGRRDGWFAIFGKKPVFLRKYF
jgi:hypothetical protein